MKEKYGRLIKFSIIFSIMLIVANLAMQGIMRMLHPMDYKNLVEKYAKEYSVDGVVIDPYLVFSIIKAESGFKPDATSSMKARGLMQITDDTGAWIAQKIGIKDFKEKSLYEPETNIKMGCWYLNYLLSRYKDKDMDVAIASYNAGPNKVGTWLENKDYSKNGTTLDVIPISETDGYVKKVNSYYSIYKKLYKEKSGSIWGRFFN